MATNVRYVGINHSIELPKILQNEKLNGNEKTLLITIIFYYKESDNNSIHASISNETICKILNCSKSTGLKVINGLVEKGYLEKVRKGQGKPNAYIYKGE